MFRTLTALNLRAQHRQTQIHFFDLELVARRISMRQKILIRIEGRSVLSEIIMRGRNEKVRCGNLGPRGRDSFIFVNAFGPPLHFIEGEREIHMRRVVIRCGLNYVSQNGFSFRELPSP